MNISKKILDYGISENIILEAFSKTKFYKKFQMIIQSVEFVKEFEDGDVLLRAQLSSKPEEASQEAHIIKIITLQISLQKIRNKKLNVIFHNIK